MTLAQPHSVMNRRTALRWGAALASSALAGCERYIETQSSTRASWPQIDTASAFALPRRAEDGNALEPPLCLGLPVVLALTAQPSLAIQPGWGLDMQTSKLRAALWHAAFKALKVNDPQGPSLMARLANWGGDSQPQPDWERAIALVLDGYWPAGDAATEDNAKALADAAVSHYANVLGVPYQRLNIVTEQMPAGLQRPLRPEEAPLYSRSALSDQAQMVVEAVTVEFVDEPMPPLLAELASRFGVPAWQEEPASAAQPALPNVVWVRGEEALVFLPRTETAANLYLLYTDALDEKQWFDRRFSSKDDGAKRLARIRELAV